MIAGLTNDQSSQDRAYIYGSSKHVLPNQVNPLYIRAELPHWLAQHLNSLLSLATIAKAAVQGFFLHISYVRGSEHWSVDYVWGHQRLRHIFIRWNFINRRIRSSSLSTLTSRITQFKGTSSPLAFATLVAGSLLLRQDLAHSHLEVILFLHQRFQRFLHHVHISLDLLQKSIALNGLVSQRLQSHADKWRRQIHNKRRKVTNDLA